MTRVSVWFICMPLFVGWDPFEIGLKDGTGKDMIRHLDWSWTVITSSFVWHHEIFESLMATVERWVNCCSVLKLCSHYLSDIGYYLLICSYLVFIIRTYRCMGDFLFFPAWDCDHSLLDIEATQVISFTHRDIWETLVCQHVFMNSYLELTEPMLQTYPTYISFI